MVGFKSVSLRLTTSSGSREIEAGCCVSRASDRKDSTLVRQRTAALRDFNSLYVGLGSFSTDSAEVVRRLMPASAHKRQSRGWARSVAFGQTPVIQTPKLGDRIMRCELVRHEWTAIKPMLPNKPRGVPRVNDRRVLNGIFWVLRSGAAMKKVAWADIPPKSNRNARSLSGSSTESNNVVGLQRATTASAPITSRSFNSRQSGYGCALMSPRPKAG